MIVNNIKSIKEMLSNEHNLEMLCNSIRKELIGDIFKTSLTEEEENLLIEVEEELNENNLLLSGTIKILGPYVKEVKLVKFTRTLIRVSYHLFGSISIRRIREKLKQETAFFIKR